MAASENHRGPHFVIPDETSPLDEATVSERPLAERTGKVFYPDFTDETLRSEIALRIAQIDAIDDHGQHTGWPELYPEGEEPDIVIPSDFQPADRKIRIDTTPAPGYRLPAVPTAPGEFRIDVNTTLAEPPASKNKPPRTRNRRRLTE